MPVHNRRRMLSAALTVGLAPLLLVSGTLTQPAAAATGTTAWQNGSFALNTGAVVSRSDVVLGKANTSSTQFLPLGNGSLGVSTWAAGGFTAQLNRSDTMPSRLSPGQVVIPGLSAMTSASDFSGVLDLYDGVLVEAGGGMTLRAWVPAGKDELIVDVTGANPSTRQTATLSLWSGRGPSSAASGAVGTLSQTWVDNSQTGSSGQTFGAMSAITAGGQNVTASVTGSTQVQVAFTPNSDGSFRVVVAAPKWTGGNAAGTATSLIGSDATATSAALLADQAAWWNSYWANSDLIEASSSDGSAQYMENLRTLYLYFEAGLMHTGIYPGSQAGLADLYAFDKDQQDWYPAGYWLWNLRGQISANLSSGNFALNLPIFDMYLNDLPAIESWTSTQMGGKPGACVPETMRFNGNGYYNGGGITNDASCATASSPGFNAETITSGAEIALWIWQQYQDTGSISFLQKYYPVLEQTAIFLLSWQSVGSDGKLHAVANAHETQWAVQDPTTDIAADQALFPAVVSAATLLGTDSSLVAQLRTAEGQIEPYARTDAATHSQLLTSSSDSAGADVIGNSYQPTAATHNVENLGLEPVWPYGVIGDSTIAGGDNLTALVDRTYNSRQYVDNPDWTYDSIDAARLDMAAQVASDLTASTESYQLYPSGLAAWNPSQVDEPYIEQDANVAVTLDEALATDYDGTVRFAPAWPSTWSGAGSVQIQGGAKVDVQVQNGLVTTAAIQAGATTSLTVRNPWAGQQAEVVDGASGAVVVSATSASTFTVPVTGGSSYLVEEVSNPTTALPFAAVGGSEPTADKHLGGKVQIGLDGNPPPVLGGTGSGGETVTVNSPGNQTSTVGTPIGGLQISASDSASGQTLTYAAAGLPAGLSVSASGLITGTPTTTGTSTVTVTATDSTGAGGSATFTWAVGNSAGGGGSTGPLHAVGAGKCLDDPNSTTTQGTQQQIWDCNGQANQTWTHSSAGALSISVSGTTMCLDANGAGTTSGTKVIVWSCNGQSNQQWNFNSNGTITGVQSGLCLDVTGAATADGTLVELWTCNGGSNQQWSLG